MDQRSCHCGCVDARHHRRCPGLRPRGVTDVISGLVQVVRFCVQLLLDDLTGRREVHGDADSAAGGLDVETRALLTRKSLPTVTPSLTSGMRLEREWRGVKEVVEIVPGGFRWRDQTFASLSKVAQAITGVKWNGPRFFGLREGAQA